MALPNLSPPSPDIVLKLAPGDLLKAGWDFIKPHIVVVDVTLIVAGVVNVALGRIPFIGGLAGFVLSMFVGPGLIFYLWRAKNGEQPSVGDILVPLQDKAGGVFLVGLVVDVAMIVGMIFLIIPGLYFGIALGLAVPIVTLTSASVSDSLSLSWKIANKHLADVIVLVLLILVLNLGGAILLGLGLLITIPLSFGMFIVVLSQLLTPGSSTNSATSESLPR